MNNACNQYFKPGKLTTIMDGGAGSSGKGKLESYVTEHADKRKSRRQSMPPPPPMPPPYAVHRSWYAVSG